MQIIPAIDIIDGKCVRLTQGDYQQKTIYNENPLEVARMFEAHGITRLHLVDLDGAKQQHIVNHTVLEKIASQTSLLVDFGGGLKSDEDVAIAFNAGASQITGGSIALKNPEMFRRWLEQYGSEKIILGADARDRRVATNGWLEASSVDVVDFISCYQQQGIRYTICTDIAKDGLLQGPSLPLYQEIQQQVPGISLIASGGVSSVADLQALKAMQVYGAIVGKAFYEGRIKLSELTEFL